MNATLRSTITALCLSGLAGAGLFATAGGASAGDKDTLGSGRSLTATLSGAAEVPGPGDPDGSGQATVTINPGLGEICVALAWQNTGPLSMAHIHEAPAGVAGGVVVPLSPAGAGSNQQCVTVERELALEILRAPADYYVNLHTSAFPAGAVRGQLSK